MKTKPPTHYQNVKVPERTHRRARLLAAALNRSLSDTYTTAIVLLWRRSRVERARATREMLHGGHHERLE